MSDLGAVSYDDGIPVTKSDTTDDPAGPFVGFFTAEGGDIKVRTAAGNDRTFYSCAAGIIMPQKILRVWDTGTAAAHPLGMTPATKVVGR